MVIPVILREKPAMYLEQLKQRQEVAVGITELINDLCQDSYDAYICAARNKTFKLGNQLVLFDTDRVTKMAPRWPAPFTDLR